jgi:hypothetical protein
LPFSVLANRRAYMPRLKVTFRSFCGKAPKKKILLSYQMHFFHVLCGRN